MTSGGARNRSGPQKDPNSARSERRGVSFVALPNGGYDGTAPEWPLPKRVVWQITWLEDGQKVRENDEATTEQVAERELEMWAWAWRTPQAWAWAQPSESWRLHTIAMWVRTFVLCESSDATAADKNALHRFADQIGMTPAGLRENGWSIARDEVGARRAETEKVAADKPAPQRRMRSVPGGGS